MTVDLEEGLLRSIAGIFSLSQKMIEEPVDAGLMITHQLFKRLALTGLQALNKIPIGGPSLRPVRHADGQRQFSTSTKHRSSTL